MIAKITGTIEEFLPRGLILNVSGVGYEIFITLDQKDRLAVGEVMSFYIAENIKEDEHSLYGFLDLSGREMYYRLTSVSGVGPKAAMSILAAHSSQKIASAILANDISLFSAVSGIGKKTAQRIILDLKGKLVETEEHNENSEDPAFQALISLGYAPKDARLALKNSPQGISTQEKSS